MAKAAAAARTFLAFHHDAKLHRLRTVVTAVRPFAALEEANRALFKQGTDEDHVVVTEKTIFHPQGGGQPSDEGTMTAVRPPSSSSSTSSAVPSPETTEKPSAADGSQTAQTAASFFVSAVRMDAVRDGQVLHLGRFGASSSAPATLFREGETVEQAIDAEKRLLYSRLHTAGHVLGAAVRHLLEREVEGFDELKASHFPDSAACEFRGAIEGRWKAPIQAKVDEYVARGMAVEVDWWDEEEFRRRGLERLIPDRGVLAPGEDRFRVVNIVGAEVYPCGGTHVDTTDLCGPTTVRKIARSKGVSRVSYSVG